MVMKNHREPLPLFLLYFRKLKSQSTQLYRLPLYNSETLKRSLFQGLVGIVRVLGAFTPRDIMQSTADIDDTCAQRLIARQLDRTTARNPWLSSWNVKGHST